MERKQTVDLLNDLIVVCHDGHKGYQEASRGVESLEMRLLFGKFALQRRQFAEELLPLVVRLGGKAKSGGSFGAAVHRDLLDLKKAATDKDPAVILEECERGEKAAIRHYEAALEAELEPSIRDVVSAQLSGIRAAVKELRGFVKPQPSARPLPQESGLRLKERGDRVAPPARQTPRPD